MKKYKNDLILIIILIILAGCLFIGRQMLYSESGEYVSITVDGKEEAVLDINEDTVYNVEHNEFVNVVEIKNKQVFVSEANCRDKICKNQGKISDNGDTIICLPHKVVITIKSEDKKEVDAVAE